MPLGGEAYFAAWEPTTGLELRATDGTTAGTHTVRDVCPGSCDGFLYYELVESGGVLYFAANDGAHGRELWRSDGTAAGTHMVADVAPGLAWSQPCFITAIPGGVAFVADDGVHGNELWWSDGTAAGTHLVADLLPGSPYGYHNGPSHSTWLPGKGLVFAAEDATHGREVWLSADGTAANTAMLADVSPGAVDGLDWYQPYPGSWSEPRRAGGNVFFVADDGVHGRELWATDGTPAGTRLVLDIAPGADGSWAYGFYDWASVLYFGAHAGAGLPSALWRSDGTAAGTYPLGDAAHGSDQLSPSGFAELGGRLYFPGYQDATGRELWSTDGTLAGTQRVTDLGPGGASGLPFGYRGIGAVAGRLWFAGDDGNSGVEWWQSDGTAAGTSLLEDLTPGRGGSTAGRPVGGVGPTTLLGSYDPRLGWTIRAAHAGEGGTAVIHAGGTRPGALAWCGVRICPPQIFAVAGGVAFPAHEAEHGTELWRSDGSESGTALAVDLAPGPANSMAPTSSLHSIAPLGDEVLFSATDDVSPPPFYDWPPQQLWAHSAFGGVTQLTHETDFQFGPAELTSWNGAVYFYEGYTVWRSDGTPAGTAPISFGGGPSHGFTAGSTHLFFASYSGIWKIDGGPSGAVPVHDAYGFRPGPLVVTGDGESGDRLYFPAGDGSGGNELWVSDGTDGGTQRVVDLLPGPENGMSTFREPGGFEEERLVAALGPRGVFAATDGTHGDELWVTDGTPGNATLLEIRAGAAGSEPRDLVTVGDRVYFVADDGVHGREPWVTDGRFAGTHIVADVRPGPESSSPQELTGWMGRLVFAANDDVHGSEIWRVDADGTSAQLVADLRAGVEPSSPQGLTAVGGRLYFFADDGASGLEPWVWSAAADLFKDGFETGNVTRWSRLTP
ncbi:MAG TPA: ELWxxDGT repeat protein [Thermoanaerobaculia bacterium]|nr:ELWxxDGT repeat protein [Thermoanaerobaculia bacterium]